MKIQNIWRFLSLVVALFAALSLTFAPVLAPDFSVAPVFADDEDDEKDKKDKDDDDEEEEDDRKDRRACRNLPSFGELTDALEAVVDVGGPSNGGLANDMWATVVNRDGVVCAVTFSGDDRGDQWPGSRVISAQKANTANSFSLPSGAGGILPGLALSTANLFSAVQPGGSLFGLQHSNPVDTDVAYRGKAKRYGTRKDPMVGKKIGGVNVFGGGVGLYDGDGYLVGALGVSGDTSCTDHVISWKVRDGLDLDNVPTGVSATGDDNIIFDIADPTGHLTSAGGFGHSAVCPGQAVQGIAADLPACFPIGAVMGPVSGAALSCP